MRNRNVFASRTWESVVIPPVARGWRIACSCALSTAIAVGVLAVGTYAQQPPASTDAGQVPSFRSRTDVLQLDVSVLDRDGQPIRGLTAADFTVLDEGVPTPVVGFSAVDVPSWPADAPAWMRDTTPDVVSNHPDARRAVVIVMDDFDTPWDPGVTKIAKSIANATIDRLVAADLAAVVYVLNRQNGQEFTFDREKLRAAVDRFVPAGMVPSSDSRFSAGTPNSGVQLAGRMGMPSGACQRGSCMHMALQNAAAILEKWAGARKTLALISPGRRMKNADLDMLDENDDIRKTLVALQNANVTVYQFDPRGLQLEARGLDDFGTFADATGGRAIMNTNAPADLVPQMFRESGSYYLLGIAEGAGSRKFHRLTVTVNRPGATVRARRGYFVRTTETAPEVSPAGSSIDRALSGGLPTGDLPMALTAVPFASAGKQGASVLLVARVDRPIQPGTAMNLVAAAFTSSWKRAASVEARFRAPEGHGPLPLAEIGAGLNLKPGRYEIRLALQTGDGGPAGSVYTSVTVPNFAREPLALSGIFVERSSNGAAIPEELASALPVRPTAARTFSPTDKVTIAARVHQRRARTALPVHVAIRIVDQTDRVEVTSDSVLDAASFGKGRESDVRFALPLEQLSLGEHLLTIDAAAGDRVERRTLRFTVR
jgi:VWFA-related protein